MLQSYPRNFDVRNSKKLESGVKSQRGYLMAVQRSSEMKTRIGGSARSYLHTAKIAGSELQNS